MKRSMWLRFVVVGALLCFGAELASASEGSGGVGEVLGQYARIHDALAADQVDGVAPAAAKIASLAREMATHSETKTVYDQLATAAEAMKGVEIAPLRQKLKELSKAIAALVDLAGAKDTGLYYCPMADGYWIQKSGDIALRNPYYGKSMLRCGEKVDKIEE